MKNREGGKRKTEEKYKKFIIRRTTEELVANREGARKETWLVERWRKNA
jgi:hypothetical protein